MTTICYWDKELQMQRDRPATPDELIELHARKSSPQIPTKVTMKQARLALLQKGLLATVESTINTLPEPDKTAARIEWDYSSEVERNTHLCVTLADLLNLTNSDLDDLFILAASL